MTEPQSKGRLVTKDVEVLCEVDLCEWLNLKIDTLKVLRLEKDFPYVRVTMRDRVYFIKDVLSWLENQKLNQPSQ